jgi:Zn-dependent M32 family carboxypeptidase
MQLSHQELSDPFVQQQCHLFCNQIGGNPLLVLGKVFCNSVKNAANNAAKNAVKDVKKQAIQSVKQSITQSIANFGKDKKKKESSKDE